jgi:hypothetical protein
MFVRRGSALVGPAGAVPDPRDVDGAPRYPIANDVRLDGREIVQVGAGKASALGQVSERLDDVDKVTRKPLRVQRTDGVYVVSDGGNIGARSRGPDERRPPAIS